MQPHPSCRDSQGTVYRCWIDTNSYLEVGGNFKFFSANDAYRYRFLQANHTLWCFLLFISLHLLSGFVIVLERMERDRSFWEDFVHSWVKPYINEPLQGFELKTLCSCPGPLVAVAAIGKVKPNSNTDKRASVGNNSPWQNSANFATAKCCKTCESWCRHPWKNILMDRGLVSVPKPGGFPVCSNP